ncbi:MAG TPA: PIN domain-containing protein [Thermoleophilaceae bacterium]|nr:PIN domain-containing protein [Thermoleophilaceae bacterium]
MSLFVDSSAFYAAADDADAGAERARRALAAGESLVTTDHVLVESWTLLRWRLGRAEAERFWQGIRGGAARVEPVGLADLDVAWEIGLVFADQDFSLVDRTSFAVMQRLGVVRVATLDDDFAVFRFGPRRERAFHIVR